MKRSTYSEQQIVKILKEENAKLKQMYAELSLDYKLLKDIVEKSYKTSGKARIG